MTSSTSFVCCGASTAGCTRGMPHLHDLGARRLAGQLWAGGSFSKDVTLATAGGPLLLNNVGGYDALLVKMSEDGEFVWAGRFGDASDQRIHDIAVDGAGDVWIVGGFGGGMQFDGGSLQALPSEHAQQDMFVVKLDQAGRWKWGRAFGDERQQRLLHVEVDAAGHGLVFGEYTGVLQGLTHAALISESATSILAARLDPDGEVVWARGWTCQGHCSLGAVALDGAGQTVLAATIGADSTLTVNAQPFKAGAAAQTIVVKLDRAGHSLWSADPLPAYAELAVGPLGEVFVAGEFHEEASLGDGEFPLYAGPTDSDLYVAKLRP